MARDFQFYQYTPSMALAIVGCVLFCIATMFCAYQFSMALSRRAPSATSKILSHIPFLVGGLFEIIGYGARAASSKDTEKLTPYIIQSLLLLVAPALFAATLYMSLGHIIRVTACENYSVVPLKWLTKIFVCGDVLSFFVQAGGGGIMAKSKENRDLGEHIVIGGLVIQIVFFGLFIVVMTIFQWRISQRPSPAAMHYRRQPSADRNWQMILVVLMVCSVLVFVRSVVRCVEYAQGNDGFIISHEYFLYVFDGLLMLLNMVVFSTQNLAAYYNLDFRSNQSLSVEPLYDWEKS
ncbi:Protein RTM1 [Meyerozyma sp. JA9]|nr:Protein RTM1 [Meyerozyma sp. JA9]